MLPGHADPQRCGAASDGGRQRRNRSIDAVAVLGIVAGDGLQKHRRIQHTACERADVIKRPREREDSTCATRPCVGFSPTVPQKDAGSRADPPVSVPSAP